MEWFTKHVYAEVIIDPRQVQREKRENMNRESPSKAETRRRERSGRISLITLGCGGSPFVEAQKECFPTLSIDGTLYLEQAT